MAPMPKWGKEVFCMTKINVVVLTEERMGQIALLFLKERLQREGIRISQNTKREIGSIAKIIGIDPDEAMAFVETITREMIDEIFKNKK